MDELRSTHNEGDRLDTIEQWVREGYADLAAWSEHYCRRFLTVADAPGATDAVNVAFARRIIEAQVRRTHGLLTLACRQLRMCCPACLHVAEWSSGQAARDLYCAAHLALITEEPEDASHHV